VSTLREGVAFRLRGSLTEVALEKSFHWGERKNASDHLWKGAGV